MTSKRFLPCENESSGAGSCSRQAQVLRDAHKSTSSTTRDDVKLLDEQRGQQTTDL